MSKVVVVCGGQSDEREVSLRSGRSVTNALTEAGHDVVMLDTDASDEDLRSCDVVFPVLHGVGGEDGQFQAGLESLGVPFVGSGSATSRLCMDKTAYRTHMIDAGFCMAHGATLEYETYTEHDLSEKPHVIKPVNGGSSIDTLIIRDVSNRDENTIRDIFERHGRMIVEELIEGDEITVGWLAGKSLGVIEIIPPASAEFDYENKYNGTTQELIPPKNVSEDTQKRAQELNASICAEVNCRDLARTDFIVSRNGELYLLETNTIPGLTDQSLFPKMAQHAGYDMPALCDHLVQSVLARI